MRRQKLIFPCKPSNEEPAAAATGLRCGCVVSDGHRAGVRAAVGAASACGALGGFLIVWLVDLIFSVLLLTSFASFPPALPCVWPCFALGDWVRACSVLCLKIDVRHMVWEGPGILHVGRHTFHNCVSGQTSML